MEFVEAQANLHPELAEKYQALGQLHDRKLWHQLTVATLEFVADDANVRGDNVARLFEGFVSSFDAKINQLRLAQIAGHVGRRMGVEPAAAVAFFEKLLADKRERLGAEAALYLTLKLAELQLALGELETVKKALADGRDIVDGPKQASDAAAGKTGETVVHSAYYFVAAEYYKLVGPPEKFYQAGLRYLSYTPLESLSADAQRALAADLALAALTGDGVYNFGEVVASPVLAALDGGDLAWLGELLRVFHRGDVDAFCALVDAQASRVAAQPALAARHEFLREKIALCALMNLVFETPPHERVLAFDAVAGRTRLARDQVEWLAMRAMALGLVRGVIDEVDGELRVTWVQPRVLDNAQLARVGEQLDEWAAKAHTALTFLDDQTPELFA